MTQIPAPKKEAVPHVAIIGAGMSGLMAARTLFDQGWKVTVFEKSRGVGGRMSTRRGDDQSAFDLGAQYFTVRDERFRHYVDVWRDQGPVALWPDNELGSDQNIVVIRNGSIESSSESVKRFVGVPAMNSICKHLAQELEVHKQTRIGKIEKNEKGIRVPGEQGNSLGKFDRVIVSAPAAQASELLVDFATLREQISTIRMNPCWAAMCSFGKTVANNWAGAFLHDSFLPWSARNSTKPGRSSATEDLVIHAQPEWTEEYWEGDPDSVARQMLEEFWRVTGLERQVPVQIRAHRWKYAIPVEPSQAGCFFDPDAGVAAGGDWAGGSRVEGAFPGGLTAAGRILEPLDLVLRSNTGKPAS